MELSIVIPTLNESGEVGHTIRELRQQDTAGILKEIIISDGQSEDDTVRVAEAAGAKVVYSPQRGRAAQMNAGAAAATGTHLHFVHADARPPAQFTEALQEATAKGYSCGCFRSRFDTGNPFLLLCSYMTRFNGLLFRGGGQTLWVERKLFEQTGGYNDKLGVMEEYDLIRRLCQQTSFRVVPGSFRVSVRKHRRNGSVRLQLIFGIILGMYLLGFSQNNLIGVYKKYVY